MLSYRHSFHAGNFADVLKHVVLIEILNYMTQKDKPLDYIDTHSGAGMYNLNSKESNKVAEYQQGIAKLNFENLPSLSAYQEVLSSSYLANKNSYPGSPCIAEQCLRPIDNLWLFEKHPKDVEHLRKNVTQRRKTKVAHSDGFAGLLAKIPPASKRAMVLIDPSYEIKSDYQKVVETLKTAHQKFPLGTYALWYPVVDRVQINRMEYALKRTGIRNICLFELGVEKDTNEQGMTSSGMIVINPPWVLQENMNKILAELKGALNENGQTFIRNECLVPE